MGHKPGQLPSTTKRIKTYWCTFCKKKITQAEATNIYLRGKQWFHNCPICGGRLVGNNPGIERRIFTV